jgi:hypothetical protein
MVCRVALRATPFFCARHVEKEKGAATECRPYKINLLIMKGINSSRL